MSKEKRRQAAEAWLRKALAKPATAQQAKFVRSVVAGHLGVGRIG